MVPDTYFPLIAKEKRRLRVNHISANQLSIINSKRQQISQWLLWLAAAVFVWIIPPVASDFGGVLHWTQFMLALAIVTAFGLSVLGNALSWKTISALQIGFRTHAIACLMLLLAIYGWIQTIALPSGLVHWLSPASYDAYLIWAAPLLDASERPSNFPVSIARQDSLHALSMLVIACLAAAAAPVVYATRERIAFLLASLAVGGAITALIGIARKLLPSFELWSFVSGGEGSPFGTFLNRNNAALTMNLALASCLGLLIWRLRTTANQFQPRPSSRSGGLDARHLRETFGNPLSILAIISGLICLVGIALCGSRGGILSLLVSGVASVTLVRSGRKIAIVLIAAVIVGGGCVLLALPSELSSTPLDQIESSIDNNADRLTNDGRLAHWPDGFRTFLKHLPLGSGLSTYSYAYLPYQQTSSWRWHHHADNLWLEMLVELGIGGIILATLFFGVLIWALIKLQHSHDPVDEALRVAGWYCGLLLLTSQFFDFGLIIPSNLIAFSLLVPVIVSRAAMVVAPATRSVAAKASVKRTTPQESNDHVRSPGKQKLQLLRTGSSDSRKSLWTGLLIPTVLAVALLGAGCVALNRLNEDAVTESLVRTAKIDLRQLRGDLPELTRRADSLAKRSQSHPTAELLDIASRYRFHQGRLTEIAGIRSRSAADISELYFNTSRTVRRLAWRASDPGMSIAQTKTNQRLMPLALGDQQRTTDSPYGQALQLAKQSLRITPLSVQPRTTFVYLEFVHQSPELTAESIDQAQSLYQNDPLLLFQLGRYSADNRDYRTASAIFQRAIYLRPNLLTRVVNTAQSYPNFPLNTLPKLGSADSDR